MQGTNDRLDEWSSKAVNSTQSLRRNLEKLMVGETPMLLSRTQKRSYMQEMAGKH